MNCTCGHCDKAFKTIGAKDPRNSLCDPNLSNSDLAVYLRAAKLKVGVMGGNTMLMTLPSGTNVVRFLVPQGSQPTHGSVGIYSEGDDPNFAQALATALAGLGV